MLKHIILSLCLTSTILIIAPTSFAAFSAVEEEALEELTNQRIEKAIGYYNDEGYEETISILRKIRGKHARNLKVQYYLGLAYKGIGNYSQATNYLIRASKQDATLKDVHLHIAQCQYFSGKYEKALRTSAQAIKNSKNPGKSHLLKGLILLKKGNHTSALKEMDKASAADDNLTYQTEYYKAIALINLSRFGEAKESFKQVIQEKPDSDLAAHAEEQMSSLRVPESKLSATISIRHEEDDNVYLLPEYDDFPIDFKEADRKDYRQTFNVDLKYKLLRKKTGGINTGYSYYGSHHGKATSRNIQINRVTVTPYISNQKVGFTLPFVVDNVELNHKRYMDIISATPTINTKLSANSLFSFYGKVRKRELRDSPTSLGLTKEQDRDGVLSLLGLAYHRFSSDRRGFFNFGVEGMKELTEGADWEYIGARFFIGAKIPFRETTSIEIKLDAKNYVYENRNSVPHKSYIDDVTFLLVEEFIQREENVYTQNIKFTTGMRKNVDFVLEFTNRRYDSNFAIYDYTKQVGSVGLDLKF